MEPTTFVETLSNLEANQWCETLSDKFASLMNNKT